MSDFKKQIEEDILDYQTQLSYINHIHNDEWAFNYWILDKIFHEDEELIESKIIEYNDLGIDEYQVYEETKEIYIIQNKFYSESSRISEQYVKNDFLIRGLNALKNGTYKKSEDLQSAFTKITKKEEFTVYLYLFVTNNSHNKEADEYIKKFNLIDHRFRAKIFYLDDIAERYYGQVKENRRNITVKIQSVNKGTILNINNDNYQLENVVDARYVFAPVVSVYQMYRDAMEKNYPIFDKNIREYLGKNAINNKIYQTLFDIEERKNFFYYNNGVTIICDKMKSITTQSSSINRNAVFEIDNPQIVNGCQTVNSIFEVLKNIDPNDLEKEFQDTFVMLKILEIDRENSKENELFKKIVKYNNSQNSIDEKTLDINTSTFERVQEEFENRGFLLLIKQSDKNKYTEKYKLVSSLKKLNDERVKRFGLKETVKARDVFIPIEKLLQVITSFSLGAHAAYTKKSNMLKYESMEHNNAVRFIQNGNVTNDTLLDLYLLYMKAEQVKKESEDKRIPISYYLVDAFAKFDCFERNENYIRDNLMDSQNIDHIISLYTRVTKYYSKEYCRKNNVDYNKMIKQKIDYEMLQNGIEVLT